MLLTCSVLYTSLVSFEVLLFSNANWTVSADHRSINMSVASLLQMQIVPLFFGFFEAVFLHAKSTRIWLEFPKLILDPRAFAFVAESWARRLCRQDYLWFRHADLFLGGPRLPPEVVSVRLNFSARWPKNLLLHGKNQACRALYYWPACQNLGVPYPKWKSCKWAFSMRTIYGRCFQFCL